MKKKQWKIKQGMIGEANIKAVVALVMMMEISLSDEIFRKYADNNPEFYNWFESF